MRPFLIETSEDDMKMMWRLVAGVAAVILALAAVNYVRPARGAPGNGAAPAGPEFVLVAHGGAGAYRNMPAELLEARRAAMVRAIQKGYGILAGGGSGLDAVEATIRVMEDSGLFDSGRGAYYTRDGMPELDAAIMDGRTLAAGAVASVQHIANPISLARLVMEKTPHVMLVSRGAEEFAQSQGIELMSPYYFYNEREWQRYEKLKAAAAEKESSALLQEEEHGTVGVVVVDRGGNLAAGTSTGGTTMKMPGRVGDSPIIGAGTYANDASCAVSGTGVGEYFMRNIVAADICERVRYLHVSLEEAANEVVMKELAEQHGEAGVIAVTRAGDVATTFNTDGMMTGTVRADGKIVMKGWSKTAEPIIVPAVK
jgi:L-asparaginase / beta-aspartyl-peptidase